MKQFIFFFLILTSLFGSTSDYESGRILYNAKGCSNCHGTNAEGSGEFPKLANKSKKLLVTKLKRFRAGISTNQNQQLMFGFAKSLSDKEIDEIATFLSEYKQGSNDRYKTNYNILGGNN